MTSHDLPIGRRVARLRVRRRMTQQMLADRLGRSKSWVDKVERGVRALDKVPVIAEVAAALRVDPTLLLGRVASSAPDSGTVAAGVDGVRAALARYDTAPAEPGDPATTPVGELGGRAEHAWLTYEHADYPGLLRVLPGLLGDARRAHRDGRSDEAAGLLVQVYRVTASVLVKLGEADLGWPWPPRSPPRTGSRPAGHPTVRRSCCRCAGRCWSRPPARTSRSATRSRRDARWSRRSEPRRPRSGYGRWPVR
ncbi:helix-turn-helix domain-containing protein [Micromonospora sp. NBC_01655]|uniref:helix-turn-helix domain-containing protein n=1 Tax=Micromonospora sp. NBC_01655 TaxID=2975983 RepID=UPI00225AEAC9|nr:helix-turn-helix domain-containing protein [Micromonospora sp. NBC_01655]MCX4471921.1 helix-turn-helix domain-containing protein [Micromonospora sp. NBC_01655]